jgi:hypothetical protein
MRRAVVSRLLAEPQMLVRADIARHIGADGAGDERVEPLRQAAFGLVGEGLVQPFRHREPQHAVA